MAAPVLHRPTAPGGGPPGPDSACWRALRSHADRWVASRRTAGIQLLVAQAGGIVFEHGAGVADAATAQPVASDTRFNLYSLTKPLTATLLVRLVLQAAIDLDEPIARATGLASLQGLGTVRETLRHRAGFANPLPLRWVHRADEDAGYDEAAFVDERLADAAARGRSGPGYSNIGYLALGRAVERATGLGFRQALQAHLIDALQPGPDEHLGFRPAASQAWSPGHLRRRGLLNLVLGGVLPRRDIVAGTSGPWVRLHRHHVNGSAYGGLIGNARGLARFGMALLGQGAVLGEPLRRLICSFGTGPDDTHNLAWFTGRLANQRWLGHAGGGLGAYGELRLYPALGTVSVLLTNRPGWRDEHALDGFDALWPAPKAGR